MAERGAREVSGLIPAGFVLYVQQACGDEAAERVAAAMGLRAAEVEPYAWYEAADAVQVALAAQRETGDIDIGRRAAEAYFRLAMSTGAGDVLIAAGSPSAAIEVLVQLGSRASDNRPLRIVEATEDSAVIEGRYGDASIVHQAFCGFPAAALALVPTLFGMTATTIEPSCQVRGDDRCRFVVRWRPDPLAQSPDIEASTARADAMIDRFEELQLMAAELAEIEDVDEALAEILQQVDRVASAPWWLIRVQLEDGDEPRTHHVGFGSDAQALAAAERVARAGGEADDALVVEVVSPRRRYGHLAAFYPPGESLPDTSRRMLSAYAAHVAAALDSLVALDTATRNHQTSVALLELARELAAVTTSDQMAMRLATAIIPVISCTSSSVWLGDGDGFALRAVGGDGVLCDARLGSGAIPALAAASMAGRPVIVHADAAPSAVRTSLGTSVDRVVLAPIVVRGEVLGVAAAGFSGTTPMADRDLVARIAALADQAGTALDNARLLERVHHDALHDRLTGLPNRALIEDRVHVALGSSTPSLLFIDLDRFKNVNDTLGHGAGDELIRQVGARLRSVLRADDTLARLGGDEFVVLLHADPELVAERIGDALRAPFTVDGRELFISCSIGIASAPADGTTYEELLQHADVAMYDAKASGRATFSTYEAPGYLDGKRDLLELEASLHRAVGNDELVVLFQPQVDLATGGVIGAEALVRWDHPTLGRLAPDRFLHLAEESGVIVDIDRFVRRAAFAAARRWRDAGLDLRIAVNLSTRELQHRDLALDIAAEIEEAGLQADRVEVEVTDRVVIGDDTLPELAERLRAVGVRIAIDDFGTGTSVLGRLRSCSVDTLKIDRGFVSEIGTAEGDTIVRALVSLGRSLDLEVVAEGIETEQQRDLLLRLGCPVGQGYLFARPVPADDVAALAYARAGAMPSMSAKLSL